MGGIVFFASNNTDALKSFYINTVGADVWLEQTDCTVFRHGNFLFGFCQRPHVECSGTLTFFYLSREEVDVMYEKLKDVAVTGPVLNERYNIYNFFAHDPEGRSIEFQCFNHPIDTTFDIG